MPKRHTNILYRGGDSSRSSVRNSNPTAARRASRSAARNASGDQGIGKSKKKKKKGKSKLGKYSEVNTLSRQKPISKNPGSKAFHIPEKYSGHQRGLIYFRAKGLTEKLGVSLQEAIKYVLENDIEAFLEEAKRLETIDNTYSKLRSQHKKKGSKSNAF